MEFMQSYKNLDNLCKDMNGVGITGYIEDMEHKLRGAYYVPAWTSDYQTLKHYRHIRNQIAHENYATEDNMCTDADTDWLENFHQRIINRTDPLALYNEATKPYPTKPHAKPEAPQTYQYTQNYIEPHYVEPHKKTHNPFKYVSLFLIALAVTILILFIRYF